MKFIPTKIHLIFASQNLVKPHHRNYFYLSDFESMVMEREDSQQGNNPRYAKTIMPSVLSGQPGCHHSF
jgi:hypothetical protein